VRLGVDAPKTVQVHRQEVFERIKSERGLPET
jgi:carbon storage regulator CsrA